MAIKARNESLDNTSYGDDYRAYLPSPFRIAVETARMRKRYWTKNEYIRRKHLSGPELSQEVFTRPLLTVTRVNIHEDDVLSLVA